MADRDCNTCRHHVQTAAPLPPRCLGCLGVSGYDPLAPPGQYLPKWEPKVEPLELSDVSLHAKVTDYIGGRAGLIERKDYSKAMLAFSGQKDDSSKPPMDLLDRVALEETARVLAFGAKKYAPHQWRQGLQVTRTCAAALRHIFQFLDGATLDRETNLNHLAYAMCEIMFALNASMTRPDLDDRHRKTEK
jgi:hypothetical protein